MRLVSVSESEFGFGGESAGFAHGAVEFDASFGDGGEDGCDGLDGEGCDDGDGDQRIEDKEDLGYWGGRGVVAVSVWMKQGRSVSQR